MANGYGFFDYEGSTAVMDILLDWYPYAKIVGKNDLVETETGKRVGIIYLVRCKEYIRNEISKQIKEKHPEREEECEATIVVDAEGNSRVID